MYVAASKESPLHFFIYFFGNLRNFETKGDTPEKHGIQSLDLQEIYQHDTAFLVDLLPVKLCRGLKKKKERSVLLRLPAQHYEKVRFHWKSVN